MLMNAEELKEMTRSCGSCGERTGQCILPLSATALGKSNMFNSMTFLTHDTFLSHKNKKMLFNKTGAYNSSNMNLTCNFNAKQRQKYSSLQSNLLSQPDQKSLHGH